jgi:hypothetical protein
MSSELANGVFQGSFSFGVTAQGSLFTGAVEVTADLFCNLVIRAVARLNAAPTSFASTSVRERFSPVFSSYHDF